MKNDFRNLRFFFWGEIFFFVFQGRIIYFFWGRPKKF